MVTEHNSSDDENFREAFGRHTGIFPDCVDEINGIKDNDPNLTAFSLRSHDAENFSDLAWELLGGYIAADNDHLVSLTYRTVASLI